MKKLLTLTAILLISLTGYNQTQQQCSQEKAIQFLNQGNYYQSVKQYFKAHQANPNADGANWLLFKADSINSAYQQKLLHSILGYWRLIDSNATIDNQYLKIKYSSINLFQEHNNSIESISKESFHFPRIDSSNYIPNKIELNDKTNRLLNISTDGLTLKISTCENKPTIKIFKRISDIHSKYKRIYNLSISYHPQEVKLIASKNGTFKGVIISSFSKKIRHGKYITITDTTIINEDKVKLLMQQLKIKGIETLTYCSEDKDCNNHRFLDSDGISFTIATDSIYKDLYFESIRPLKNNKYAEEIPLRRKAEKLLTIINNDLDLESVFSQAKNNLPKGTYEYFYGNARIVFKKRR